MAQEHHPAPKYYEQNWSMYHNVEFVFDDPQIDELVWRKEYKAFCTQTPEDEFKFRVLDEDEDRNGTRYIHLHFELLDDGTTTRDNVYYMALYCLYNFLGSVGMYDIKFLNSSLSSHLIGDDHEQKPIDYSAQGRDFLKFLVWLKLAEPWDFTNA